MSFLLKSIKMHQRRLRSPQKFFSSLIFFFFVTASTSMMQSAANSDASSDSAMFLEKDLTENFTINCEQILKCPNGCSPQHQSSSNSCFCPQNCHKLNSNCTKNGETFVHFQLWQNPLNPCESFVCVDGSISTHIASCAAINCQPNHRVLPHGACCEICNSTLSFCDDDENRDCDIACRFDFVRDEIRDCDLCKCTRMKITTTTTEKIEKSQKDEKIEILKKEEKIERNLENLTIFLLAFATIFAFLCFLVILVWIVRVKMYKRIPLMAHRQNLKRDSNCTNSSNVSGCESV